MGFKNTLLAVFIRIRVCLVVTNGWKSTIENGIHFMEEFRFTHRNEPDTWVICQAAPEFNLQGLTIGFVGTLTDITRLKQAEDHLQAMEHTIQDTRLNKTNNWFTCTTFLGDGMKDSFRFVLICGNQLKIL